MAFMAGFNFRATSGYVTDGANETYVIGDVYPTTRNNVTFGWTSDIGINPNGTRDRNSALDRRLAGVNFIANSGTQFTFQVDLPASGAYTVNIALGDTNLQAYEYCQVKDGSTVLLTLDKSSGIVDNQWYDAAGTLQTSASNWVNNQQASGNLTFVGQTLSLVVGTPTLQSGSSSIAHLFVTQIIQSFVPAFVQGMVNQPWFYKYV